MSYATILDVLDSIESDRSETPIKRTRTTVVDLNGGKERPKSDDQTGPRSRPQAIA